MLLSTCESLRRSIPKRISTHCKKEGDPTAGDKQANGVEGYIHDARLLFAWTLNLNIMGRASDSHLPARF